MFFNIVTKRKYPYLAFNLVCEGECDNLVCLLDIGFLLVVSKKTDLIFPDCYFTEMCLPGRATGLVR